MMLDHDSAICDVLIADDTGPAREVLRALLRRFTANLGIREARNGAEAVKLWDSLRPRLTFLDIDMPTTDGLEALRLIREQDKSAFVAIVSSCSSAENVKRALGMGANAFIVKPYKPQRIVDALQRYEALTGRKVVLAD
jgi:two-component system, chemotaxis family, chemotaxis protein CheY